MKPFARFSIFMMFVIFSISVLAVNDDVEKEIAFDPAHPEAGKYRVASDSGGFTSSSCYTHSKAVVVKPSIYPKVRISDYAWASISSMHIDNHGDYHLYSQIPQLSRSAGPIPYNGNHSDWRTSNLERDVWMGSPDISACSANARISASAFIQSEAEIPFP